MSKLRIAVLRGGPSHTYDDSLKSGAYILSLLRDRPEQYDPLDIFVSREGEWHHGGLPIEPHRALSRADLVWNAMRGSYGEDGEPQQLMEGLKVPFIGSSTVTSSFSHNKDIAKEIYRRHSLNTPEFTVVRSVDDDKHLAEIFRSYLHPVIVKPATGVRALGVRLAHTFEELKDAVKRTFAHSPKVLVEEYVRGTAITCAVVEKARGEDLYALTPMRIITTKKTAPSPEEHATIEEMAKIAHRALGLRHYSNSDFIITPRGKIYILETNSLPPFYENSLLHRSLKNVGWKPSDFAEHCVHLAYDR